VLVQQSKLDEAMKLFKKSLNVKKVVWGEDHPGVADIQYYMASVLKIQGKLEEASQMFKASARIYERAYGSNHPDVAHAIQQASSAVNEIE